MKHILSRVVRITRIAQGYVSRSTAYWLGSGLSGAPPPRMPKRYCHGPFGNRRWATLAAFYPAVLAAWGSGRICALRRERRRTVAEVETVRYLPLLSAAECADLVERIHKLRDRWTFRQPGFFTLGLAAYMDCHDQPLSRYLEEAPLLNAILMRNFGPIYERLISTLQTALGESCTLIDGHAIPGFHIWLGDGIPSQERDAGSVHFDLQYLDLGFREAEWPTQADIISFTLPVRLPAAGGGLNVWDIRFPEKAGWEIWPFTAVSRVNYSVGSLVLHSGHELHQIAPVESIDDGDERICLQGHGIRKDGNWFLYW